MIAIGYTRVSTTVQAEEGVSLDAQAERVKAWCVANGHELRAMETDAGLSGGRADNRPALQRALDAVCKARGVLIVYSLSRLARSTRDALEIVERLHKAGANLVSLTESIDTTTAMGRFFFTVLSALAALERDLISERTSMAMAHKKAKGEYVGGEVPYGWRIIEGPSSTKLLTEDDEEQSVIRLIRALHWGRQNAATIARRLNQDHMPARGSVWHAKSVRRILGRTA